MFPQQDNMGSVSVLEHERTQPEMKKLENAKKRLLIIDQEIFALQNEQEKNPDYSPKMAVQLHKNLVDLRTALNKVPEKRTYVGFLSKNTNPINKMIQMARKACPKKSPLETLRRAFSSS